MRRLPSTSKTSNPHSVKRKENCLQTTILLEEEAKAKLGRCNLAARNLTFFDVEDNYKALTELGTRLPLTDVRHCSQHAGANVDFGDEGAVDWAFLGNLKQLRALLLG